MWNILGTKLCVRNRQVFWLYRLSEQRLPKFKAWFTHDSGLFKVSYKHVWFTHDSGLFKISYKHDSGLFKVSYKHVWFTHDPGLFKVSYQHVWFTHDSGLFKVSYQHVSMFMYIVFYRGIITADRSG
jgi:hypothetical protein